jgi:hypothetical protein
MVKRREGVGSPDGAKFANREQLSAQTPSPDVSTLEPTGRRSFDSDIFILLNYFSFLIC